MSELLSIANRSESFSCTPILPYSTNARFSSIRFFGFTVVVLSRCYAHFDRIERMSHSAAAAAGGSDTQDQLSEGEIPATPQPASEHHKSRKHRPTSSPHHRHHRKHKRRRTFYVDDGSSQEDDSFESSNESAKDDYRRNSKRTANGERNVRTKRYAISAKSHLCPSERAGLKREKQKEYATEDRIRKSSSVNEFEKQHNDNINVTSDAEFRSNKRLRIDGQANDDCGGQLVRTTPLNASTVVGRADAVKQRVSSRQQVVLKWFDIVGQGHSEKDEPDCSKRASRFRKNDFGERSLCSYRVLHKIGEGTYGKVYKAIDSTDFRFVAMKRVQCDNEQEGFHINTIREIHILRQLRNPNIVNLLNITAEYRNPDKESVLNGQRPATSFFLVFEYCDHDLCGLISSGLIEFSEVQVASLMKQILLGIDHCHQKGIIHRDLKCSNILMTKHGQIKIADFGLARVYAIGVVRPYTNRVVTLWYRAPELAFGEECYGPPVDIWSCGCIMGELIVRRPLFRANDEFGLLEAISKLCGSPYIGPWAYRNIEGLPNYNKFRLRNQYMRRLRQDFHHLSEPALNLFDHLLTWTPSLRQSAHGALESEFLKNVDPDHIPLPVIPDDHQCHELWFKQKERARRMRAGYHHPASAARDNRSTAANIETDNRNR